LGGNILYLWVSKSPSIGGFRGRKSIIYDRAKYILNSAISIKMVTIVG